MPDVGKPANGAAMPRAMRAVVTANWQCGERVATARRAGYASGPTGIRRIFCRVRIARPFISARVVPRAGARLSSPALVRAGEAWVPLSGEGGHVSFAPSDEREDRVLAHARKRWPHGSFERLAAGPGIAAIHEALAARDGRAIVETDPAVIVERMLAGDADCGVTLDCFCAMLGTFAGNLALTLGATGGIHIGGGGAAPRRPFRCIAVSRTLRGERPLRGLSRAYSDVRDHRALSGVRRRIAAAGARARRGRLKTHALDAAAAGRNVIVQSSSCRHPERKSSGFGVCLWNVRTGS